MWAGGLRGGIAVGTIIANAIMASMVGIIGAEIVTFGLIALPEMLSKKYDHKLALGSVAAGGGLATLIPPSVVFIVYGMTAGVSVGELFLAGIMPGLMLGGMFIFYVIWRVWRNPESAPLVAEELRAMPVKQKLATLKELTLPLFITAGVLGSIYTGVATPSEAAGVGVILALVSASINRKLNWPMVRDSLYETLRISCMLSWLFFGAQTIIGAYTLAGGTTFVTNAIKALDLGPWGTVILMNLIWVLPGLLPRLDRDPLPDGAHFPADHPGLRFRPGVVRRRLLHEHAPVVPDAAVRALGLLPEEHHAAGRDHDPDLQGHHAVPVVDGGREHRDRGLARALALAAAAAAAAIVRLIEGYRRA